MNRHTRALAALSGALALTATGTPTASAAIWSHDDAVGDVESFTYYADDQGNETETGPDPDPANTDTDITRFSIRHSARRVVLRTTLRDITAASGQMYHEIRTGTRGYEVMQRLGTNREEPAFLMYRANGDRVRCSGLRRNVDRATEQVTLDIPRRCLGRPRWVRAGAGAVKSEYTETATSFSGTSSLDDALEDALQTDILVLSPRVRRG